MEIKIVTAFFDIGRGDFKKLCRADEKYFEYFRFWARLKNELTVYCSSQNAEKIKMIRREYGLEDKTHIVEINDYRVIESAMFDRMQEIERNEAFKTFRFFSDGLSNMAKYCYVTNLKWWCLSDASKNEDPDQRMAWIDFGYNHGGELYIDPGDFDFMWDYEFDDKINMFCLSDPQDACSVDNLQFQSDCFIGHTAIMPAKYCDLYWTEIKQALLALMSLDCIDDDQQTELMVYKKHPEWFNIRICNWFEDMQLCSNGCLKTRKKSNRLNLKREIREFIYRHKRKYSFYKRMKKRYKKYGR